MSSALKRDYVVSSQIGSGAFSNVFRCTSVSTGAIYAVKSVNKYYARRDTLGSLLMEPEILNLVSPHPHIVSLHAVYEDDKQLDMVLDLCHDKPDFQRLVPKPEPEAASIMAQLMRAVTHCHRLGVAHRDVKPDNIMFAGEEVEGSSGVKLVDFGYAAVFREGEMMNGLVGTPRYMAPEVVIGGEYSEKVDVWSCGVVLYVMLAGFRPFGDDDDVPEEVFEAVVRDNLRFPSSVFQTVSPEAKDLISKMLCKDVSRRFSAEQVLSE